MTLRLEKIALVFQVRIVPTSSEDSWTIIFVCPYILWFKKVQVALSLAPLREVQTWTFTLEIFNSRKWCLPRTAWEELCLCISRRAACPVALTSFSPPGNLGGRALVGPEDSCVGSRFCGWYGTWTKAVCRSEKCSRVCVNTWSLC